jgi:zinc protease
MVGVFCAFSRRSTGKLEKMASTYYIKKNAKPEKKVDLRLVVNAGSILETDDQQGFILWSTCVLMEPNVFQNQLVDYLQLLLNLDSI